MEITVRRVRRGDFSAICDLLSAAGLPVPPPERAVLRRFRRIVADLGSDLYVAAQRERVTGFFHLTYGRDLLRGRCARLMALVAESEAARRALIDTLHERAERQSCSEIAVIPNHWTPEIGDLARRHGWVEAPLALQVDLPVRAGAD